MARRRSKQPQGVEEDVVKMILGTQWRLDVADRGGKTTTYESSDTQVAEVDKNGVVSAKAIGDANVIVRFKPFRSDKISIRVVHVIVREEWPAAMPSQKWVGRYFIMPCFGGSGATAYSNDESVLRSCLNPKWRTFKGRTFEVMGPGTAAITIVWPRTDKYFEGRQEVQVHVTRDRWNRSQQGNDLAKVQTKKPNPLEVAVVSPELRWRLPREGQIVLGGLDGQIVIRDPDKDEKARSIPSNVVVSGAKGKVSYSMSTAPEDPVLWMRSGSGAICVRDSAGRMASPDTYQVEVKVEAEGNRRYDKASKTVRFKLVLY